MDPEVSLEVEFGGLKLDNPVIVSSSHFTGYEYPLKKCIEQRPGAIVLWSSWTQKDLKTFTGKTKREDVTMRPSWAEAPGKSNFHNLPSGLGATPEATAEIIVRLKKETDIPMIGSAIAGSIET